MASLDSTRSGALPVETRQAGGVPGPQPRRGPTHTTMQGGHPCPTKARNRGPRVKHRSTGTQEMKEVEKSPQLINILQWNAEGIFGKKDPLKARLDNDKIAIACIQETHLNEDKRFGIRGYQTFRMDRKGHKGGVIILVKNDIPAKEIQVKTERPEGSDNVQAEIHGVNITLNQTNIKVYNVYCPDNKNLSLQAMDIPTDNCLVIGDFNSHSTSWGYEENDTRGDEVEDWQSETSMVLINDPEDPPTFYSRRWMTTTTPDLAFASGNLAGKTKRKVLSQLGGSDHRPVLLSIALEYKPKDERTFPRWNYKKANWENFQRLTDELCRKLKTNHRNINHQVKRFNDCIIKAAEQSIPRGARKNYRPYWTKELQELEDDVEMARTEAELHPTVQNNIALKASAAKCKKTYIQAARTSWRQKTSELNMDREGKKLWNLVRAMNDEERQRTPIFIEKNQEMMSGWRAANCFIEDYEQTSNIDVPDDRRQQVHQEMKNLHNEEDVPDYMEKPFSINELQNALADLKNNKSPGPDKITNDMIKHLGEKAKTTLLAIFNNSWKTGQAPQIWRKANMVPIHKKGKDKSKTSSYRPISLTSCIGKVLERMINTRLTWHLETNGIITNEQAGFRPNRSTEDQAAYIAQSIEDGFQAKQHTLAVWIDMEKAFDKVWKDGLRLKLQKSGVSGCMYRWISQYLDNRKARVQMNGFYSRKKTLREGVPQGGVLSPTLFLVFINDIMQDLPFRVQGAMYADDLVLWRSEHNILVARNRLQEALDILSRWTKTWMVKLNPTKTTYTVFSLSTSAQTVMLRINEQTLQQEPNPTYLGVTFDKRLTWKAHIEKAEKKAKARLSIMRKLAGSAWGADMQTLKRTYTGNVRPALEYGMAAWGTVANTHFERLKKVQNQATRVMTGAIKSTPVNIIESTTGVQPLEDRRDTKILTQAAKFRRMPSHPMNDRIGKPTPTRLKRISFVRQAKQTLEQHGDLQNHVPKELPASLAVPPWEIHTVPEINLGVPGVNTKNSQTDLERRVLASTHIETSYPLDTWTRVFTDGSAEDAVKNGGAGIYVQFSKDEEEKVHLPTGFFSTNYKAEAMALEEAAKLLRNDPRTNKNVVFLTDALSVLQALKNNRDKDLNSLSMTMEALRRTHNVELQWVPAHCGLSGNETADLLAKQGARGEQLDKTTTYNEEKTIIKACQKTKWRKQHPNHNKEDPYYKLNRHEQVIIFRLRTNHNRLKHHLHKTFRIGNTDQCPCGDGAQTAQHVLQSCRFYKDLREKTWPSPTLETQKLYGCLEALQCTAAFIVGTGLAI